MPKITQLAFTFVEDATAPTATITNPLASDWLSGISGSAIGTASDATSAISLIEYRVDSNGDGDYLDGGVENFTAASGTISWNATLNIAALGEGSRSLQVQASDQAGNQFVSTRSFGVDLAAPNTSVTAPGSTNIAFTI